MKTCMALLLCVAMSLSCVMPALAAQSYNEPAQSSNLGDYEYTYDRWANPIASNLVANADGTLTRVEYTGEKVVVEEYSADFQFISGFSMDAELPLFGGFYSGETHNFLVFGQENDAEDDNTEVIRVVCYTKDWQRVGSDGLYGANTTIPFRAGSVRFAEADGYLYIRTCHQMYTSKDGLRHQANVMINFRIADTTITDSCTKVSYDGMGYVSHSFNQFVLVDGDDLLAVDHGDAYPRSVVLFKYVAPAGQDSFQESKLVDVGDYFMMYYVDMVNVLHIDGQTGANDTGVALGGFEVSDSAYLIAGNTVSQEPGCDLFGQRNIFISVTSKNNFTEQGTTVRYLTDYAQGDNVKVSNPHFVQISNGSYAVLWTETDDSGTVLRYCFVNGQGQVQGEIYSTAGALSDCKPVVSGDKLIWYVTHASGPAFFTIDLEKPQDVSHGHIYTYEYSAYPWYDNDGALCSVCSVCGKEGPTVTIPSLKNLDAYTLYSVSSEATCTQDGYGYFRWKDAKLYDVPEYIYGAPIPATGHDWVAGDCETPASCSRCGLTQTAPGHNWSDATCTQPKTCTICGKTQGEPAGHHYRDSVTAPTCTEGGHTTHICTECGDSYEDGYVSAVGHSFGDPVVHRPTPEEQGYTEHSCITCGYRETYDYVSYRGVTLSGSLTSYLSDGQVTVELLKDGQVIQTQILSGENTSYCFENLEQSQYTLRLQKQNHAPVEYELTLGDEAVSMDVKICPFGDVTGDGLVNIKDFQRLLRHVNKTNPLSDYALSCGDVTGDGVVNIKDFQRLLRHVNKTNPLF